MSGIKNSGDSDSKSRRVSAVDRAKRETQMAREREMKIREIRGSFANFGHRVVTHMVGEFIRFGHLKNTCKLLSIQQPNDFSAQRTQLVHYLEQSGSRTLINKLDGLADTEGKPAGRAEIIEGIIDEAVSDLLDRVMNAPKDSVPIHAADTHVEGVTKRYADPAGFDAKTGLPIIDGVPVERRANQDRRSGLDRRQRANRRRNVELIFANRRFGRDRRSGKDRRTGNERRKNWPPEKK